VTNLLFAFASCLLLRAEVWTKQGKEIKLNAALVVDGIHHLKRLSCCWLLTLLPKRFIIGPYHGFETNQSAWTLLGQRNVTPTHMSNNNLVSLPRNLFPPQSIPKGSRQALYVTAQASVICFEVSLKSLLGGTYESVAFNTTDFELHVGTGVTYRFGEFGLPSILSGILEYVQTNA
jgi:hypothetical protein